MVNFQGSPTYERPCRLCSTNLRIHLPRSCTGPDPAVVPPLDVNDDYTEWHRSGQSTIPPKVAEVSPPNLAEGRRRNAARIGPHPRFTDPMSGLACSVPRIFGHIDHGAAPGTSKGAPSGSKCGLYRGSSSKECWPSQTEDFCQSGGDPQTSAEMLDCDVIARVEDQHAKAYSQVRLVIKPYGAKRFCIDFRALNMCISHRNWPLPVINQMLHRLGTHKPRYCAKFDRTKGY